MRNYDLDFLKKFSLVIGFLVAGHDRPDLLRVPPATSTLPPKCRRSAAKRTQERIAPVGAVYAGATGAAAQAAATAAAAAAAASQVAYGGTTDGSVIFGNLCTGCHTSGAGSAPTLDKAHWARAHRAGQGHAVQACDRGIHTAPTAA